MAFNEVIIAYPIPFLAVVSCIVTLLSTLAHKYLTDQAHLSNQKARQKELQKELKGCKDPKKLAELNAEMLQITGTMFRASLKPMLVTFIPFILIFTWLRGVYVPVVDGVAVPIIDGISWLWYYIGFSIIASMILRKVLKVA